AVEAIDDEAVGFPSLEPRNRRHESETALQTVAAADPGVRQDVDKVQLALLAELPNGLLLDLESVAGDLFVGAHPCVAERPHGRSSVTGVLSSVTVLVGASSPPGPGAGPVDSACD